MRRRITKNEPFSCFSSLGEESPIDLTLSQGKDKPILPYEPIDLTKENIPPIDLTFEKPAEEECDILIKIDTDEEEEIQEEIVYEQCEEENDNKTEIQKYLKKMRQGIQFPFHFFGDVKEEEVGKLP